MTMSIIKPTIITDATFVSSTATETDYAVWAFGTFTVGNRRIMTTGIHKIYECLVAHTSTDGTGAPNLNITGATPKWLEVGATNRWAMFDTKVGSRTLAPSPLTTVIAPGSTSGLGYLEMVGRELVITGVDVATSTVVYSKTVNLDATIIDSFYGWFFEDFVQQTDLTLTDLPGQYVNMQLTSTISGTSGNVGIGVLLPGKVSAIGDTQYGAAVGVISYSTKTTDVFGNVAVVKRSNSKRNSLKINIEKAAFTRIYKLLAALDSIPCIYVGTEVENHEPLLVYGYWKDFSIDVAYYSTYLANIEIEGLI